MWLLASNVARLGQRSKSHALRVGAVVTGGLLPALRSLVPVPFAVLFVAGMGLAVFPVLGWRDRLHEEFRQGAPKASLAWAALTIVAFAALAFAVNRTLAALGFDR